MKTIETWKAANKLIA